MRAWATSQPVRCIATASAAMLSLTSACAARIRGAHFSGIKGRIEKIAKSSQTMPRGGSKPGERRGGRQKGSPNRLPKGERALVKLDAAEAEVRALVAEGLPLETLGKDRLTELDAWAHAMA